MGIDGHLGPKATKHTIDGILGGGGHPGMIGAGGGGSIKSKDSDCEGTCSVDYDPIFGLK